MARPLGEYFAQVRATDIHDYSGTYRAQNGICNFLNPAEWPQDLRGKPERAPDWIVTNPPFRRGEEFVSTATAVARSGVAVLVRTSFLEGKRRYKSLFEPKPPTMVLQFVERVPMVKGRLQKTASTATSYCWIVWSAKIRQRTQFQWIAPCRSRLERPEDYSEDKESPDQSPLW
ncbi:hypothetical protein [Tateyamaria sp. syn59]|uniref:hypothetical protein n=1 Tax=Tateyamaria sp. syn59 TaxID=2576942 RepID=UPI001CB93FBB|nr:hypothetical protein [Tateyamaria sp. syn59]